MATIMAGGIPERIPYSLFVPNKFYDWIREKSGEEPGQRWHLDNWERWVSPKSLGKPPWDQPWGDPPDNPKEEKLLWQRFQHYLPDIDVPGRRVTEYGTMTIPSSLYHLRKLIYPMEKMESVKELEDYPFPDITEEWRWEGVEEKVQEYLSQGYWVRGGVGSIFETAWLCRGQERFFLDLYDNPDFVSFLLDKITVDREFIGKRLAQMEVDSLSLGDDMGVQNGLIMSLPMLRQWILSRWDKVISAARAIKPDVCVDFHTDGRMQEAIPALMAIGVTAINPVQPECDDPEYLKKTFGKKLVLKGTMSARNLTFGTPETIRAEVKVRMETGKRWGGLVLQNNNTPDRNTPYENFSAFLDAAEEYGRIV